MSENKHPHRPTRGARSLSREFALLGLYQWLVSGTDAKTIDKNLLSILSEDGDAWHGSALDPADFDRCDKQHFSELLNGVIDNAQDIEALIGEHLDRDIARLSLVERSVLMMATYEMKFNVEIPYRVIINEAVELSKQFGGNDGFRFVNGVLDKVAAQTRAHEVKGK